MAIDPVACALDFDRVAVKFKYVGCMLHSTCSKTLNLINTLGDHNEKNRSSSIGNDGRILKRFFCKRTL